jgi:uncharacterized protein DUF4232
MITDQGTHSPTRTALGIPPSVDTEALIKEAKRHQRRRYAFVIFAVIVVAAVVVTPFLVVGSGRQSPGQRTATTPNGILVVSRCATSAIRLSDEGIAPGAGNAAALLLFRNTSGHACSMEGYPRVSAVTVPKSSRALRISYVKSTVGGGGGMRGNGSLPTSVLEAHGGQASFWIVGTPIDLGGPALRCVNASRMLVTPPRGTGAVALPNTGFKEWQWCGRIFVTPVLPGDSGTYPPVPLSHYFGVRNPADVSAGNGTSPTPGTTIPVSP